jgi:hypothetical protein
MIKLRTIEICATVNGSIVRTFLLRQGNAP